jgi:hypothetical protein
MVSPGVGYGGQPFRTSVGEVVTVDFLSFSA